MLLALSAMNWGINRHNQDKVHASTPRWLQIPLAYFLLTPNQYHLGFGAYPHTQQVSGRNTQAVFYGCNINLFTCDGSLEF